jgi:2,5-dihydroxypyridine 5,6-dioxygenase
MKAGVPVICMDGGMTLEMFQSGAATEDLQQLEVRQHYVATRIFGKDARVCRVTSKFGSDLTYRVDGRIFVPKLPGEDFDRAARGHHAGPTIAGRTRASR